MKLIPNLKNLRNKLIILFAIAGCFCSNGTPISVTARLDSVNLLMGNLMTLHLEVVENQGAKGEFPLLKKTGEQKGYIGICGDSVELRTDYSIDTIELGSGKIQLNYAVNIQAFDSGTYTLPKFVYISGNDSAASNHLTFNVVPVAVTAEDPISPFATVAPPDNPRFYDWIPDWLLDFWWIWLIIFLTACLFLWGMKNYKRKGIPFISPKVQPKPWEIALGSLQRLKARKLWEQGLEKEYFTDLTDILREYLFERFGINAMEMTSRQIMEKIYESDLRDKKDYVKQILNVADFVKFAKVRPLPADSIAAYDNAVKFVEETIPAETPESDNPEIKEGGNN